MSHHQGPVRGLGRNNFRAFKSHPWDLGKEYSEHGSDKSPHSELFTKSYFFKPCPHNQVRKLKTKPQWQSVNDNRLAVVYCSKFNFLSLTCLLLTKVPNKFTCISHPKDQNPKTDLSVKLCPRHFSAQTPSVVPHGLGYKVQSFQTGIRSPLLA